jgi:hypothetical protein
VGRFRRIAYGRFAICHAGEININVEGYVEVVGEDVQRDMSDDFGDSHPETLYEVCPDLMYGLVSTRRLLPCRNFVLEDHAAVFSVAAFGDCIVAMGGARTLRARI